MFERVIINLTFSADLDGVPGSWDCADDWVRWVKHTLESGRTYDPRAEIHSVRTVRKRYVEGKGWVVPEDEPDAAEAPAGAEGG